MKKTVRLYITRHGQTEFNLEHRAQGLQDSPLTLEGRESATRLGKGLRGIKFDYAYSSSSKRASDTAQIALDNMGFGLALITDDNLRERGLGKLEGRILGSANWDNAHLVAEMAGHVGKLDIEALDEGYQTIVPLDGEPIEKPYDLEELSVFKARLKKALDDICASVEGEDVNVFVVSHGFAIVGLIYELTGNKYSDGFVKNASVTVVENVDGVYHIRKFNDTSYIE